MVTVSTTAGISTPTDRSIRTERTVDAPRRLVWRAFTEPDLLAQWWGRGHRVDVERWEAERGGHWRLVEHSSEGVSGFEGRFREISPPDRIVWTFEYDGMPGYVSVETVTFEELDDSHTRIVTDSLFFTTEERDGMLNAGMEQGMSESYSALDRLLTSLT
jgi:uncharacterized protein YndB with AHSA1/START domain